MTTAEKFRSDIDTFLEASGMTPTAFGREAMRDPNFVFDIRAGRVPNLTLVERAMSFIDARKKPSRKGSHQ